MKLNSILMLRKLTQVICVVIGFLGIYMIIMGVDSCHEPFQKEPFSVLLAFAIGGTMIIVALQAVFMYSSATIRNLSFLISIFTIGPSFYFAHQINSELFIQNALAGILSICAILSCYWILKTLLMKFTIEKNIETEQKDSALGSMLIRGALGDMIHECMRRTHRRG